MNNTDLENRLNLLKMDAEKTNVMIDYLFDDLYSGENDEHMSELKFLIDRTLPVFDIMNDCFNKFRAGILELDKYFKDGGIENE